MMWKISILFLLFSLAIINSYSQESRKELKERQKIENQKKTEALVNTKEFVFTARTALPQGGRSVNLTTRSNFMKFHPDLIESEMPYYGRAYSGAGYGGDSGLKFAGKPEKYTVVKEMKYYQIHAEVKSDNDTYKISLSVGFEGSTSLTVISNNRSTISYQGDITAPEQTAK
jgi:hypothetical protein